MAQSNQRHQKQQPQQQHQQAQPRQQQAQPRQQLAQQQQQQLQQDEQLGESSLQQGAEEQVDSKPPVTHRTRGRPRNTNSDAADSAVATGLNHSHDSMTSLQGANGAPGNDIPVPSAASGTGSGGAPAGAPIKRRRGRPRKTPVQVVPTSGQDSDTQASSGAAGPGGLRDVPEGVLRQRRDANPRESPSAGVDVAFD